MKARLDRKTKILTAAVLCACTTLWASPVWAASGGTAYSDGAYYGEKNISSTATGKSEGNNVEINAGDSFKGVYGGYAFGEDGWGDPLLRGTTEANNNVVIINGGKITGGKLGGLYSYYATAVAGYGNYVTGNTFILEAFSSKIRPLEISLTI